MQPAQKLVQRPTYDEREVRRLIEVDRLIQVSQKNFLMVKASQFGTIQKNLKSQKF